MNNKILIENPSTYDDVNNYITIFGASILILLLIIIFKFKGKKKKRRKRK